MTFAVDPSGVLVAPDPLDELFDRECSDAANNDDRSRDIENRLRSASNAPVAPKCVCWPLATVSIDISTCPVFAAAVCVAGSTRPAGVATTATCSALPPLLQAASISAAATTTHPVL